MFRRMIFPPFVVKNNNNNDNNNNKEMTVRKKTFRFEILQNYKEKDSKYNATNPHLRVFSGGMGVGGI